MKVEYIDHMGSDLTVVNAARVSFAKCHDQLDSSDERLISYLADHNHWTPFAHPQITLMMAAPIPIRTQCFKHKQGFVENEESRRYIAAEPQVHWPREWRGKPVEGAKQGSFGLVEDQQAWHDKYSASTHLALCVYEEMIENGVCPEQARFVLPQGVIVQWYWTGSLAAYARFYKQRKGGGAQKEVGELAEMVGEVIQPLFPFSWKALTK